MEYSKEIKCNCGKVHYCDIDSILIGCGAINDIAPLCDGYKSILLVGDNNTYPLCGDRVCGILGNKITSTYVYQTDSCLIPNEKAIAQMEAALPEGCDLIIGIGSGVIQDLCKYVSFIHSIPYHIIATAPSMDGYASVGSALILDNMKVTKSCRVPKAIICDIDIIKDAPMDMIRAGYGDILGKFSCLNDWKLSHVVNDEYYCPYIVNMTHDMVNLTKNLGAKLQLRDPDAIETLTTALIYVGVAMAYSGNSRPASGSEHHMSHYFEIVGLLNNEEYFMHGIDVAYSSVYTQRIREKLMQINTPNAHSTHNPDKWRADIERIYTTAADEVKALQNKLGWYDIDRNRIYADKWDEIKSVLSEAPSSDELIGYLESVGLDIGEFDKMYGKDKIDDAILYAKDLKDRYSVLWMNYELN